MTRLGLGVGGNRELLIIVQVSCWGDANVLKLDCDDGWTTI